VHAGIKLLSTANSSFILDRRRRSIRLCAVFRAIFLPAALVADGCLRFVPAVAAVVECPAAAAPLPLPPLPAAAFELLDGASPLACSSRGFIWMILRERVGGGGSANCSLGAAEWAADERRRDLTVSLAWVG
jgi:hypothetical protein